MPNPWVALRPPSPPPSSLPSYGSCCPFGRRASHPAPRHRRACLEAQGQSVPHTAAAASPPPVVSPPPASALQTLLAAPPAPSVAQRAAAAASPAAAAAAAGPPAAEQLRPPLPAAGSWMGPSAGASAARMQLQLVAEEEERPSQVLAARLQRRATPCVQSRSLALPRPRQPPAARPAARGAPPAPARPPPSWAMPRRRRRGRCVTRRRWRPSRSGWLGR